MKFPFAGGSNWQQFGKGFFWQRNRRSRAGVRPDTLDVELESAAEGATCPLCTIVDKARRRSLWSLLWEYVNDPDIRKNFLERGGFCPGDTLLLLDIGRHKIGSLLGIAILYKSLVDVVVEVLGPHPGYGLRWIDVKARRFEPGKRCLACETTRLAMTVYAERICLAIDAGNRHWIDSIFPLCREHLEICHGAASGRDTHGKLIARQRESVMSLGDTLQGKTAPTGDPLQSRLLAATRHNATPRSGGTVALPSEEATDGEYECPVCRGAMIFFRAAISNRRRDRDAAIAHTCGRHIPLLLANEEGLAAIWQQIKDHTLNDPAFAEDEACPAGHTKGAPNPESPKETSCPFCLAWYQAEQQALKGVIAGLGRPESIPTVPCLDHLEIISRAVASSQGQVLITQQRDKLIQLSEDLGEFIESHDYQFKGSVSPGARSSCVRALRLFAGPSFHCSGKGRYHRRLCR